MMDVEAAKVLLEKVVPDLGIALAMLVVSKIILKIPAATLENMWLDAMITRFVLSLVQLAALFVAASGFKRELGFQGTEGFLTTMLTSGSVVIGLASQDVLSNFAAGIVLIFTRPFEVGDNISVAGKGGVVKSLSFFNTKVVTSDNEGVSLPNSAVLGSAMQNNSDNYNQPATPSLREVNIGIYLSGQADVEQAIGALGRAGKKLDAFIAEKNANKEKNRYDNGTHTLAEFHKVRYGTKLDEETKANPTAVFIGGQAAKGGHYFELRGFADQTLYWPVFQTGYRFAVQELKVAGIQLFDSTLKRG